MSPRISKRRAPLLQEIDMHPLGTVVISSRIRLARNIVGEHFPDWCSSDSLKKLFVRNSKAAIAAGRDIGIGLDAFTVGRDPELDGCLYEMRYLSRDLIDRPEGAGYLLAENEPDNEDDKLRLAIMLNEEDHIRIQAFRRDYDLEKAWQLADAFDSALEKHVKYAFSQKLGYLTSCPSNLGTGMRASVMLTLPGLLVCNEFESTCRALERLGVNVRGINGEKTTTSSCIVQISNRGTLGFSEHDVIARLKKITDEVIRVEYQARRYAIDKSPVFLNDMLGRSLSLLQHARVLQSEEAINALTAVKFGVELGLIAHLRLDLINELLDGCGYYAMRKQMLLSSVDRKLIDEPDIRDAFRSSLVRGVVGRAKLTLLPEVDSY